MHNENKVPLIRLAKRDMMEPWKVWCIRLASIVLALLLGGLVMMIALPDGATPIDGYATIVTGALGKKTAEMGVEVLNGTDPKTMAVGTISDGTPVINSEVMEKFGFTVPEKYADAEMVTTNSEADAA